MREEANPYQSPESRKDAAGAGALASSLRGAIIMPLLAGLVLVGFVALGVPWLALLVLGALVALHRFDRAFFTDVDFWGQRTKRR